MTAQEIARHIEVSRRTIYRDLRSLMEGGVPIEGEAGVGYSLRKEFYLPPLMFTDTELRALAAAARMIHVTGDADLMRETQHAIAKIEASLPPHLKALLCPQAESSVAFAEAERRSA
jgi:predicted DNA-binding transcriptional regulator YafY